MGMPLRALIVEDSEDDAILLLRELRRSGYDVTFERVDTPAAMKSALYKQTWDIIIADYSLPQFNGLAALALLQESGLDVPFILVSGTIGEEIAVKAMKAGAQDYIMKANLSRLVPAIDRELREAKGRRERERLEAQFLRAQRMESIGALTSGIAHDLNNVLSPILLAVGILRQKPPEAQAHWVLATVESNVKRGQDLVEQVLAFGRGLEKVHIVLQPAHLIREMEKLLREVFPKGIEIRTDIAQDLWTVSGDATQLHQILMNLCVNARDAMPDGGMLNISAENFFVDENHKRMHADARVAPYVIISISDTGTGIPPEILGKVFEPFFTTKEMGKGTGLGLSTVFSITKGHGGFMEVCSTVGSGTAFRVYLPATEAAEVQKKPQEQPDPPGGNGELILVVDDEASIREITRATLEAYGYRVITAHNGAEAIGLYLQNRREIQMIVTDIMMPVTKGLTSVRILREMNPQLKILAVSGLPADEILNEATDIGVQAFLQKPYPGERLLDTLHKVLHGQVDGNLAAG